MTGFIGLGTVGRIANSQGVGTLPWDVNEGLLAFEDMSQSQLQSGLTALGFTQTRTGTALRTQTGTTPGSWYEVAQNVLGMMPGSTSRYGLFVGSAVTNRCLRSNKLDEAVWTKTNVTATYTASSGLANNGYSTLTATANNGTCAQTITDTSNERIAGAWVKRKTGTGRVWMSQGAVTGSPLYEDDFSTDTSSEWSGGVGFVDGTIAVTGGKLVYTRGAGDTSPPGGPRIKREITGLTPGKICVAYGALSKTGVGTPFLVLTDTSNAAAGNALLPTSNFTSTSNQFIYNKVPANGTLYVGLAFDASTAGSSAELDDVFFYEVAETELALSGEIQLTRLPPATFANQLLVLRFETSGDAIEVYNVNAQRGTILEDPIVTAGSAVTRNAESCVKTLGAAPSSVDVSFQMTKTDAGGFAFALFGTSGNYIRSDDVSSGRWRATHRKDAGTASNIIESPAESPKDIDYIVRVLFESGTLRLYVDAAEVSPNIGSLVIPTLTGMVIGSLNDASSQINAPIYRITGVPA